MLLNMTVGQTDLHPAVLHQLTEPLSTPAYFAGYKSLEKATIERLRTLLGADSSYATHILLGTGRTGLEAGVYNLLMPGDTVVCFTNGQWGQFFAALCETAGAQVVRVQRPSGVGFTAADIRAALHNAQSLRVTAVTMIHCETSTGVLNPIQDFAALTRMILPAALVLVDGISSFAGCAADVQARGIDFYCGGSQKCLNAPQGTPVVCYSPRAQERVARVEKPKLHTFQLGNKASYLLTRGLDAVAKALLEEGLEQVYGRHRKAAAAVRAGLGALGLDYLANQRETIPSPTTTRIRFSERIQAEIDSERKAGGIDADRITQRMMTKYNVVIAEDRIGTMGAFATLPNVLTTLDALANTLVDLYGLQTNDQAAAAAAAAAYHIAQ